MEQESGMKLISLSPRHRSKISQPSAYLRKTCNCLFMAHSRYELVFVMPQNTTCFSNSVSLSTISSPTTVELEKHVFLLRGSFIGRLPEIQIAIGENCGAQRHQNIQIPKREQKHLSGRPDTYFYMHKFPHLRMHSSLLHALTFPSSLVHALTFRV